LGLRLIGPRFGHEVRFQQLPRSLILTAVGGPRTGFAVAYLTQLLEHPERMTGECSDSHALSYPVSTGAWGATA
jgi:hypothetical protein